MTVNPDATREKVCHAIQVLAQRLIGRNSEEMSANMGQAWEWMSGDPQLRW